MIRHLLWQTVLAVAGIVLIFFLLFRLAAPTATIERPAAGGAYVEGVLGYSDSLNPILLSPANPLDADLSSLVFDSLTVLDEAGRLQPALATEWQVSDDGTVYDFKLRRGVQWHDGMPFTSADVAFTVQAIQDPGYQGAPALRELWQNVIVEPQGDYAVRFVLKEPYTPFPNYTTIGLLPAHLLSDIPAADLPGGDFSTAHPVGTGMFRVERIEPDRVALVANANYWGRRPYLERLEFWSFGDWDTLLAAYERGEVQGIQRVPPDRLGAVSRLPNVQLYSARSAGYGIVYLNLQRTSAPFFQEKAVRQALMYALDRQALIDGALGGEGIVAHSPVLPGTWAYDPDVRRYPYDVQAAVTLLDGAGWKDSDGDRIRDRDGIALSFTLLTAGDATVERLAAAIVEQWRALGIDARTESAGERLVDKHLTPRDFDAVLIEVGLTADPDPYPFWHSTQIGGSGQNYAGFIDVDADVAIEEARAMTDPEQRADRYRRFQDIFAEEVPSLLIYYPIYTYAVDARVRDVQLSPLWVAGDRFRNLAGWYVETQQIVVTQAPALDKTGE